MDKSKQAANAVMDDILDSTVGVDNLVIPEIPISNTRAGLYIYLSASVSVIHTQLLPLHLRCYVQLRAY